MGIAAAGDFNPAILLDSAFLLLLAVDSLMETNLGMPAIFGLYLLRTARWQEDLRPRRQTVAARFAENQAMRYRR